MAFHDWDGSWGPLKSAGEIGRLSPGCQGEDGEIPDFDLEVGVDKFRGLGVDYM